MNWLADVFPNSTFKNTLLFPLHSFSHRLQVRTPRDICLKSLTPKEQNSPQSLPVEPAICDCDKLKTAEEFLK